MEKEECKWCMFYSGQRFFGEIKKSDMSKNIGIRQQILITVDLTLTRQALLKINSISFPAPI